MTVVHCWSGRPLQPQIYALQIYALRAVGLEGGPTPFSAFAGGVGRPARPVRARVHPHVPGRTFPAGAVYRAGP